MESLPIEIIRRIAIYTSYPTVYALSRVSNKFRAAVHDWQVYKAIIDNRNHEVFRDENRDDVSQALVDLDLDVSGWARNPITSSFSANLCARYAYADYKCFTMAKEEFWDQKAIRGFARWAGIMAARGLPLSFVHTGELYVSRAFANIFELLGETFGSNSGSRVPGAETTSYWNTAFEGVTIPTSRTEIDASYAPPTPNIHVSRPEDMFSAFSCHELCLRAVGLLGYRYRRFMAGGSPRFRGAGNSQQDYDPRQQKPAPTGFEFPFETYMKLPAPFGDAAEFVWSHLEIMTSKAFLEEGKWMGFYNYGSMKVIDPAMIDIRFRVVELDGQDSHAGNSDSNDGNHQDSKHPPRNVLNVTGSGEDNVGKFTLYGQIVKTTGKIQMKKVYTGTQLQWDWLGFMTPFGIVGRWGNRGSGGDLWLWKEDWYRESEEV
ncbi:hypothetical protein ABW20_dc0106000 [Dactylellina cionopaga]|nr:hypothetical protein ABW20_dc0106000 [Dactylellina cionopaga]